MTASLQILPYYQILPVIRKHFFTLEFTRNLEFLENLKIMFPHYYIHIDISNSFTPSSILHCIICFWSSAYNTYNDFKSDAVQTVYLFFRITPQWWRYPTLFARQHLHTLFHRILLFISLHIKLSGIIASHNYLSV